MCSAGNLYRLIPSLDNLAFLCLRLQAYQPGTVKRLYSAYVVPLRQLAPHQEDIVLWSPHHGSENYVLRNDVRACWPGQLDDNLTTRRNAKGLLRSFW
jgi:hypothetical protein